MTIVGGRAALSVVASGVVVLTAAIAVLAGALADDPASATTGRLGTVAGRCVVVGDVAGLTSEQAQNAGTIVASSFSSSGEDTLAARIALMVALTETGLRNLGPGAGRDDSLGLFQQRASQGWGTAAEEMDPAQATTMFVQRLLRVPGWASLDPWVAAQQVQRAAFADGANYRANWDRAGAVLAAVLANGSRPGGCDQAMPAPAGSPSGPGLPAGYAIPAGTPPAHATAVAFALAQIGKPYVWGAAGPDSYDCSGLTMMAWAAAGVRLTHYTLAQLAEGRPVEPAQATAGDLVFIPGANPPGPGLPGHVGIYLGAGQVLSAADSARGVVVRPWKAFVSGGLIAVIDPAPGA